MLCQKCQNAQATVHIDEVKAFEGPCHPGNEVDEHHLCEQCAQESEIPHIAVQQKSMDEVWKLLQMSAMKAQTKEAPRKILTCSGCGTTLEQLRRKGRLGCQGCYSTFAQYLQGLLERMHGSTAHVGRVPGVDGEKIARRREIEEAEKELERAISEEAFERAAELRDRLTQLIESADEGAAEGAAKPRREDDGASATS